MHQLKIQGFINPFLLNNAKRDGVKGVIKEGKVVTEYNKFTFVDECPFEDGKEVTVRINSDFYCQSFDEINVEKEAIEQRRADALKKRNIEINESALKAKLEADTFNESLNIPFKWHSAFKPTLTGLMPNSDGTGLNRASVVHIQLEEDYKNGRLTREKGDFLCSKDKGKQWSSDARYTGTDPDGNSFNHKVTCKACLKLTKKFIK